MKSVFTFYSDPGHAWLKVSVKDALAVGLSNQDFSTYSYYRNGFFYLEEDLDAGVFIQAYIAKNGQPPQFRESVARERSSRIRTYAHLSKLGDYYPHAA